MVVILIDRLIFPNVTLKKLKNITVLFTQSPWYLMFRKMHMTIKILD
jgi:hypothetical protein